MLIFFSIRASPKCKQILRNSRNQFAYHICVHLTLPGIGFREKALELSPHKETEAIKFEQQGKHEERWYSLMPTTLFCTHEAFECSFS